MEKYSNIVNILQSHISIGSKKHSRIKSKSTVKNPFQSVKLLMH